MKFINHFLKKHWLWALVILLALWLLPRLLNVYALVLANLTGFIKSIGELLRIPQEYIAQGVETTEKLAGFIAKNPLVTFAVPVLLFSVSPVLSALISAWGILDLFKGDETITITRTSQPVQTPAPTPDPDNQLLDLQNWFSPRN